MLENSTTKYYFYFSIARPKSHYRARGTKLNLCHCMRSLWAGQMILKAGTRDTTTLVWCHLYMPTSILLIVIPRPAGSWMITLSLFAFVLVENSSQQLLGCATLSVLTLTTSTILTFQTVLRMTCWENAMPSLLVWSGYLNCSDRSGNSSRITMSPCS